MSHDTSRRRFIASLSAVPLLGATGWLGGCGRAAPAEDADAPGLEPEDDPVPKPDPGRCTYFLDQSGFIGERNYAIGMLVCTHGSLERQRAALAALRDALNFRAAAFSRVRGDAYRATFANAALEHLLTHEELEYHALTGRVEGLRSKAERKAKHAALHGEILARRPPATGDQVVLMQRTSDPTEMQPILDVVARAGSPNVSSAAGLKRSDDLMQLCDYVTHAVRGKLQGTGSWRARESSPRFEGDKLAELKELLTTHLGTTQLGDGSLAQHATFSVRPITG